MKYVFKKELPDQKPLKGGRKREKEVGKGVNDRVRNKEGAAGSERQREVR